MQNARKKMRVLITGVAGFIGSNVAEALLAQGHSVIGLDNMSQGDKLNIAAFMNNPAFEMHYADIRDEPALMKAAAGCSAIVHLAAYKIPRYSDALDTLLINSIGSEAVVKVEDAYEIPSSREETIRAFSQNAHPPTQKVTQEEVDAALARAQVSYLRSEVRLPDFGDSLRSVFDGLPEIKVSSVKGKLIWNSFQFSRKKCGLFAFRFTVPQTESVELDYVGWLNQIGWQRIGLDSNVIARSEPDPTTSRADFADWYKFDLESYVEAAGIGRLEHLQSGARSLNQHGKEKSFIFWIYTGTDEPDRDFEFKTVLFSTPADKVPLRRGVLEVCEHIGLRTNIPKIAATPDGVREALRTLDIRGCWPGRGARATVLVRGRPGARPTDEQFHGSCARTSGPSYGGSAANRVAARRRSRSPICPRNSCAPRMSRKVSNPASRNCCSSLKPAALAGPRIMRRLWRSQGLRVRRSRRSPICTIKPI